MAKEGSKLDGLARAFFYDTPYQSTGSLARQQLVELKDIEAGQRDQSLHAKDLVNETKKSREVAERMLAPLLMDISSGLIQGNEETQSRLRDLGAAFSEGNEKLASRISSTGDQISGIPRQSKSLEELLSSRAVDEVETVILAASRVLEKSQAERFFRLMPAWKIEILSSGLVTKTDFKAERALTSEQKVFLAQLRRKTGANPADFRSLKVFARQGLLDAEIHEALAERIPGVRFGIEGLKHEVRDLTHLARETSEGVLQKSDRQIALQSRIAADSEVGVNQRDMALRLMRAGILKTDELIDVGRTAVSLDRENLRTNVGILGEIRRSGDLADRAALQREAISRSGLGIERNTADLVDLATDANVSHREISDGIGTLNLATGYYGDIQAAQMEDAQNARLVNLDLTRALLAIEVRNSNIIAGISRGVSHLSEIGEMQLDKLEIINEGIDVLRQIGTAQLETSNTIIDTLGDLRETLALGVVNIVQIVEAVRQTLITMEARTIDREKNSDRNLAEQSFQKAMKMLQIGKIDKAIKFFDESEDRWPADFKVYFERGLCHVMQSQPRAAEEDFSDALKLASDPENTRIRSLIRLNLARLYYSEAKAHFERGRQPEYEERLLCSIEEAKKSISEDPEFLEAQFALATYLAAYKLYDEAIKILVEIIPLDPKFIEKISHFDVFTPLRDALKNTLGEEFSKQEEGRSSAVSLHIALDCVGLGDFETAKKCLTYLLANDPAYLRESKFWENLEFRSLENDIVNMLKANLGSIDNQDAEWGYSIIGIVLNFSKIGRGSIYNAFRTAVQNDVLFKNRDSEGIKDKLKAFTDDKFSSLIQIIKTKNPPDLPEWLVNTL
ncbi:MAG: hypothetical protein AAB373_05290 [Patescibacteria group bacterium]